MAGAACIPRSHPGAPIIGLCHSTVKRHPASSRSQVGATTTTALVWMLAERLPEPEVTAQGRLGRRGKRGV